MIIKFSCTSGFVRKDYQRPKIILNENSINFENLIIIYDFSNFFKRTFSGWHVNPPKIIRLKIIRLIFIFKKGDFWLNFLELCCFLACMKKINTLTVKLLKKFSSQNNKPYKFGVPIFQKLGGLLIRRIIFRRINVPPFLIPVCIFKPVQKIKFCSIICKIVLCIQRFINQVINWEIYHWNAKI